MKIVDVAEFYAPNGGGVRTYIDQKLLASALAGHETVIVAPGPFDAEERRVGGRVIWVKAPALPFDPRYHMFSRAAPVLSILAREAPDVVEASSPWRAGWIVRNAPVDALKILFMHADPVASYAHTLLGGAMRRDRIDTLFGWYWALLRRLSGGFNATVVSGRWLADRFDRFGLKRPLPVPFGIDKTLFSPARRCLDLRAEMLAACGLPPSAHLLINASRLHPEKRHDLVIGAVAKAETDRPIGLLILGDGVAAESVARRAARVPHVRLADTIRDRQRLATVLASADALLHGCAAETFGFAVAEALCAGTPVIVPNVGGAHDLAAPDHAEIFAAGDVDAAARAIERLFARDQAALRQAAATTRLRSYDEHFTEMFALYASLATERAAAGADRPALQRA